MEELVKVLSVAVLNLAGWGAIWYKMGKLEGQAHAHRRSTELPGQRDGNRPAA